ncbi:MAG: hypothetical protein Q8Q08_00865 [Candidatus Omnitrophota bacterium]|nr:hypothetical protein [Candidatus Omnitrophota bacterium]MDZ4242303.1 hypothetical protein [Candidatus Omnitrophota bacterium]
MKKLVLSFFMGAFIAASLLGLGRFLAEHFSAFRLFYNPSAIKQRLLTDSGDAFPEFHEIQRILPSGAAVDLSWPRGQADPREDVFIRTLLYPLKVEPGSPYVIDFKKSFNPPGPDWRMFEDGGPIRLFVRPGAEVADESHRGSQRHPVGVVWGIFMASSALTAALGFLICRLAGVVRFLPHIAGRLGLYYLTGFLAIVMPLWIYLMAGGTLSNYSVGGIGFLSVLAACCLMARKSLKNDLPSLREPAVAGPAGLLMMAGFFLLMVMLLAGRHTFAWDEMSNWSLRAKMLFHDGQFIKTFNHSAASYPPAWPIYVAFQYFCAGESYDKAAYWAAIAALFCFYMLFLLCLKFMRLRPWMAWGVLAWHLVMFNRRVFTWGLPENILLAFFIAATALTLAWLQQGRPRILLILVSLMCAGMCSVKGEGAAMTVILGLAVLWAMRRQVTVAERLRIAGWFAAPVMIPFIWVGWLRLQGFPCHFDQLHVGFSGEKIAAVITTGVHILSAYSYDFCAVISAFLALFLLRNPRGWSREEQFLLFSGAAVLVFSLAGGLGWQEPDKIVQYYPEVFGRLSMKAVPPLVLFLCSRFCDFKWEGATRRG